MKPPMRREGLLFRSAAAGLLLLTVGLHFWRIGSVPPGFYIDESSVSYNAWSLAETGADENGNRFPVFFEFEGQYQDAVLIYTLVPFVTTLGLHEWAVRLPSPLFHLLASAAFALLVYEYCRLRWLALAGGFLFSVAPWGFPVARTAVGAYTAMLLGLAGGWWLAIRALKRDSISCAIASGLMWALAMHSYHAGRPMAVLMLGCLALAHARTIPARGKVWGALFVACVLPLLPMLVQLARAPQMLTARFEVTSVFRDHPSAGEAMLRVASRYLEYLGPGFLFLDGDPNLRHHTGHGGELYWFLAPLIAAGLFAAARDWRSDPACRVLLLIWLTFPAVASLTMDRMHSTRCFSGVIASLLLASVGARFLWERAGWGRKLLLVACCVGAAEVALYMHDYFGPYRLRSRNAFNAPFTEALKDSFLRLGRDETLYLSVTAFAPLRRVVTRTFRPYHYVDILFFGQIDPRLYQRGGIPPERVSPYEGSVSGPGLLLRANVRFVPPDGSGRPGWFEPVQEALPAGAELLETRPLGPEARYELYRVRGVPPDGAQAGPG